MLRLQGEDGGEDFTVPYDVLVLAVGANGLLLASLHACVGCAAHALLHVSEDQLAWLIAQPPHT